MRSTRAGCFSATCTATNAPRLDPMRTTGPDSPSIAFPTRSTIRVMVSVEKSGSLRSGVCSSTPCSRSFPAKKVAFEDRAEEAKPCRSR